MNVQGILETDQKRVDNKNNPHSRKMSTANRIYMIPSPEEQNQLSLMIGSNIKSQQQQRV